MRPFPRRLSVLLLSALVAGCATDRLHREGVMAFEKGAYEESIASLQQAVEKDPSNLEYRSDLRARRDAAVQQLTVNVLDDMEAKRGSPTPSLVSEDHPCDWLRMDCSPPPSRRGR